MKKNKSSINIKYKCLGASKEVTGSCHYLDINVDDKNFGLVVDFGGVQDNLKKLNELYSINKEDKFINWENVLGVIISHAHS